VNSSFGERSEESAIESKHLFLQKDNSLKLNE
jgi:hypothetical protein